MSIASPSSVSVTSSVRVDLLGGTLDLDLICQLLPQCITLNCATNLTAKVAISYGPQEGVIFHSDDYHQSWCFTPDQFTQAHLLAGTFGPMGFLAAILDYLQLTTKIVVHLSSQAPVGSGLGGSSAMGIGLFLAARSYLQRPVLAHQRGEIVSLVKAIEARHLDSGPTGFQDYYPALYGGILALHPQLMGVKVEQLFTPELQQFLATNFSIVYSGRTRHSGINNWEVYQAFFNKDQRVRQGLQAINHLAQQAYQAIKSQQYQLLPALIAQEGECREQLFQGIVTEEMKQLLQKIRQQIPRAGMKACGAGGGGCYLITHGPGDREKFSHFVAAANMELLAFVVQSPVAEN